MRNSCAVCAVCMYILDPTNHFVSFRIAAPLNPFSLLIDQYLRNYPFVCLSVFSFVKCSFQSPSSVAILLVRLLVIKTDGGVEGSLRSRLVAQACLLRPSLQLCFVFVYVPQEVWLAGGRRSVRFGLCVSGQGVGGRWKERTAGLK